MNAGGLNDWWAEQLNQLTSGMSGLNNIRLAVEDNLLDERIIGEYQAAARRNDAAEMRRLDRLASWARQVRVDIEKAKLEARSRGHSITEQSLSDGSIKLTVQVTGGAA